MRTVVSHSAKATSPSIERAGTSAGQADSKKTISPNIQAGFQFKTAEMAKVIGPVVSPILPSIAAIERGKKRVALGIVVSSDGKILTKLSNLRDGIQVDINGAKYTEIKVLGIHKQSDLAMLKINATDLPPAEFSQVRPTTGSWLISPAGVACVVTVELQTPGHKGIRISGRASPPFF